MSSMNNWLAFSLSPQHHHQQNDQHHLGLQGFNSDDISGATYDHECFDLSSSTAPPPPSQHPFDALDDASASFNNRNNSNSTNLQTQDWNNSENGCFKTTSEMSAFMGSSCNNNNNGCHSLQDQQQQQQQPKLENFLARHSLSNSHYHHSTAAGDYMFSTESMAEAAANNNQVFSNNNSSIGLSMIKTWLRSNQGGASGSGHVQQSLQQQQIPNNNEMFRNGDDESCRAAVLCGGGGGDNDDINKAHTGGAQTLSLSMSTGSQSNSSAPLPLLDAGEGVDKTALGGLTEAVVEAVPRKSLDTFGQRTSIYRGVTRHRWTGRYEAHLWDNSCRREGQTRKGRQGGYDKEEKAARAYDLAALKYWGTTTTTNFPISSYEKEIEEMKHMTRQEYVASLRRKSSGFSRGASIYRGVTRHHQHGRWQARIGRVAGNKDLYLGTFSTQEEAAEAYDIAAIKFRGLNAVTNFEMSRYDVNSILESSTLPIGGAAKRLKDAEQAMEMTSTMELGLISQRAAAAAALNHEALGSHLTDATMMGYSSNAQWPTIAFHHPPYNTTASMHQQYSPYARVWCKQEQDSTSDQGTTTNQSYHQDLHQLQLGNGATHNFFQQPNTSVLHNLMSLGSSSMEHSSGSNSVIYGNGEGHGYNGYGASVNNNGGFAMPVGSTLIGNEDNSNVAYGTANAYNQARNLYYLQQQQLYKGGGYDQDSGCTSWVPTAIPNLGQRSGTGPNNNLAAAGNQPFTVWNETWK
ncbi:hypothetical protein QQ045_021159 [Rhodiola kirilowii]